MANPQQPIGGSSGGFGDTPQRRVAGRDASYASNPTQNNAVGGERQTRTDTMGKNSPSPQPKTYSPQEQAAAQIQIDEATSARQQAAAAQEQQRKDNERAQQLQRTAEGVNAAYGQGQTYGQQKVGSLGYADTYGILDRYNSSLGAAKSRVPTDATNPGSYFDYDALFGSALNESETAQRGKLDNQYRGLTKPGWEQNYFADTADDSILDAILGEQYGETFDTIDAARARGQISQGAFDNTLRGLDNKKTGARAKLEDLGLGVLGGYRDELDGIATQFGDSITGYKLGQNVNLDDFSGQLNSRRDSLTGRMRGDIYNAVGDTQFFNPDSLIAKGGAAAGVSNNPLRNAFLNANGVAVDPERTTGTTGVF